MLQGLPRSPKKKAPLQDALQRLVLNLLVELRTIQKKTKIYRIVMSLKRLRCIEMKMIQTQMNFTQTTLIY